MELVLETGTDTTFYHCFPMPVLLLKISANTNTDSDIIHYDLYLKKFSLLAITANTVTFWCYHVDAVMCPN